SGYEFGLYNWDFLRDIFTWFKTHDCYYHFYGSPTNPLYAYWGRPVVVRSLSFNHWRLNECGLYFCSFPIAYFPIDDFDFDYSTLGYYRCHGSLAEACS